MAASRHSPRLSVFAILALYVVGMLLDQLAVDVLMAMTVVEERQMKELKRIDVRYDPHVRQDES